MKQKLASIISLTFNPFLLALLGVFLITTKETNNINQILFYSILTVFISICVFLFMLYGLKKKLFSNLDISQRRQRFTLYPALLIALLAFFVITLTTGGPPVLAASILYLIPTLLIFELLTLKTKASIHLASVSAAATGIVYYYGILLSPLLIILPIVAWARVVEKKHTPKEVIVGALFGSVFSIIGIHVIQWLVG